MGNLESIVETALTPLSGDAGDAYRSVLLDAPAAIAVWHGPRHVYQLANPAYAQMVSRDPSQLVGRTVQEVFPELGENHPVFALFDEVYRTGQPHHAAEYEVVLNRGNGPETGWFAFTLSPVRSHGRVSGLIAVAVEVTQTIRAHRKLLESEHRYQQILDSVSDLVFTRSKDFVVTYANRAACAHYGLSREQLRGATDVPLQQRDSNAPYLRDDRTVFETGRAVEVREEPNTRHDGVVRLFHTIKTPIRDIEGNVVELVGVARDVTEERRLEDAERRAAIAEAQQTAAEASRRRFEDVLTSLTEPFSVLDDELRLVFSNEAAIALTGIPLEAARGKKLLELIPEARDSAFVKAYERCIRERVPVVVEDYFAPWQRWFEVRVYPLREGGISAYTRDVTERKRAESLQQRVAAQASLRSDVAAALAGDLDARQMLQRSCEAMVAHLKVAFARVWLLDEATQMLELQASAGMYTHLDGAHRQVPVGQFKIGKIAKDRAPHLTNDVQHDPLVGRPDWARAEGMVAFAGYPLLVDGRLLGVMAMFSKSELPDDTLTALGGIADTLAQGIARRQAQEELQVRVKDLARSNADLEQFAYVASHDLQEPLRMVASYNQLLARRYKGKLDKDADEFIAFTVEGVSRMQRLINDLLAYSRVGTRSREPGEVKMGVLLERVIKDLGKSLEESQGRVTFDPLPTVTGDEGQLGQLLQNLVGNALKFRGTAPPRVHVSAKASSSDWVFSVRDEGIGIEPQYFERVFIIFQRLNPREQYDGTGIGLAISKRIVERHGGRIWLDSKPGEGTTVFFTLPQAPRARRLAS